MRKIQLRSWFSRKIFVLLNTLLLCSLMPAAQAAMISMSVSSSTVNIGDTIDIDFRISGLSASAGDSLSGFDFDILFNQSAFSFAGFGFADSVVGNQLDLTESGALPFDGDVVDLGGGRLDAYGLSGNSEGVLDTDQVAEFSFLTLSYTAIAATSGSLFSIDLADPFLYVLNSSFLDLTFDFDPSFVSVAVEDTSIGVPEPATLPLLMVCLLFMWNASRKRRYL